MQVASLEHAKASHSSMSKERLKKNFTKLIILLTTLKHVTHVGVVVNCWGEWIEPKKEAIVQTPNDILLLINYKLLLIYY